MLCENGLFLGQECQESSLKRVLGLPSKKRGGDYQRIVDLTRSIHNKEAPHTTMEPRIFKTNGTWFLLSELGICCRFLNVEFFHSFAVCISNSHNILPKGYQLYVPIAHQAFPCTYFTSTVSYCIVVKVGTMLNASYELQYTY